MNSIWPRKLITPHIELGIDIDEGLNILNSLGAPISATNGKEKSFTCSTPKYDVSVYETEGKVSSVWFNDPSGRFWSKGKAKKISLYLARYGNLADWQARLNNGYIQFYFNDVLGLSMAYGIHKDVIRFNQQGV